MDLATDPYLVDVDGEANDDDLFGNHDAVEADNVGPRDEPHAPVVPGEALDDNVDLGEDLQVENAENRILPCPNELTPCHIEDHRAEGHIPYRSWCSECVRARWTGDQHRRRRDRREICVFSFDYLHLDKTGIPVAKRAVLEGAEVDLTILVAKDSLGKNCIWSCSASEGRRPRALCRRCLDGGHQVAWVHCIVPSLGQRASHFEIAEACDHRVTDTCGAARKDPRRASSGLRPRREW